MEFGGRTPKWRRGGPGLWRCCSGTQSVGWDEHEVGEHRAKRDRILFIFLSLLDGQFRHAAEQTTSYLIEWRLSSHHAARVLCRTKKYKYYLTFGRSSSLLVSSKTVNINNTEQKCDFFPISKIILTAVLCHTLQFPYLTLVVQPIY